jgi:uncharacterized membrane protein YphA (DoxX/SURF4 family)
VIGKLLDPFHLLKEVTNMLILAWVTLCLRILVATVFITYAVGKLQGISTFAAIIRRHQILPDSMSTIIASVLPALEMVLGLLFLFNVFPIPVGILLGILLIIFSGILLRAKLSPRITEKDCGCSKPDGQHNTIEVALLRNALLLFSVGVVVVVTSLAKESSLPSFSFIEEVMLTCIIVWEIFTSTKLSWYVSSVILPILQTRANRDKTTHTSSLTIRNSGRRSFVGWGIKLGIGVLVGILSSRVLDVFAYCANCLCGPSGIGSSPECVSIWDCNGQAGNYVPIYRTCRYYCCDETAIYCDATTRQIGLQYCDGGGVPTK